MSYRGINGGISVAPGTPNPTPTHIGTDHIAVTVAAKQFSVQLTWSQIGWQMGFLERLPSGVGVYSDSPTIFFEGVDNVAAFRDVYGPADQIQRFEVSWGGPIGGRFKYNGIYYINGVAWIAGYAQLDRELTQVDTQGEASDRPNQACLALTANRDTFHDMGVNWSLEVLTDVWRTWTSALPQGWLPDTPPTSNNCGSDPNKPYRRFDYFPPDHYRIGAAGPC